MTEYQREKTIEMRNAGCGYSEIAKELSISRDTIKTFCRRKNIEDGCSDKVEKKENAACCSECGKPLVSTPGKKPKRFCNSVCRQKWWNAHQNLPGRKAIYEYVCPVCGKPFTAYGNSRRKYCSHDCYIKARFKGGECHD